MSECHEHLLAEKQERDAWIGNAQFHLDRLRATIQDGLTNPSDIFLRVSLMDDLESVEDSLRRVLR